MDDEKKQAEVHSSDINKILEDPANYPLPKLGTAGILALELSEKMTKDNFVKLDIYLARLGPDLEIVAVLEALRRDSSVMESPGYINFAKRHMHITF